MQIHLNSPMGYSYTITSTNPKTIGEWFQEILPEILSANVSIPPWELVIRPDHRDYPDTRMAPRFDYSRYVRKDTPKEWQDLAYLFLGIAGRVAEREE